MSPQDWIDEMYDDPDSEIRVPDDIVAAEEMSQFRAAASVLR